MFSHGCVFVKILRDGRWSEQDAAVLVPGDIISIKLGDIIPADARLLEGDPLKIDQVDSFLHLFRFHVYILPRNEIQAKITKFALIKNNG